MKAILVIDMPSSCAECTLRTSLEANYLYCIATLPRLKIDPMTAHNIKKHKCPLKPMPSKRKSMVEWIDANVKTHEISEYDKGWNDCVEFIELGGENND